MGLNMNKLLLACFSFLASFSQIGAAPNGAPNIIYVLCDDLGYGDVKCLNPQGKIATPNIDALAAKGMIFTDVHSSSSDRKSTRLNSSHTDISRMPSSA